MRLPQILSVALLLGLSSGAIANSLTTLVDKKGRNLEVQLLSHTKTHVECVKKKGGKTIKIPLRMLSAESVETIRKFPLIEAKVDVRKERAQTEGAKSTAFGTVYTTFFKPSITVSNSNPDADVSESEAQLFLIAEGYEEGTTYHTPIFSESYSFTPKAQPSVLKGDEVEKPNKIDYQGYVLFITDSSDSIISAQTDISMFKGKLNHQLRDELASLDPEDKINPEFTAAN